MTFKKNIMIFSGSGDNLRTVHNFTVNKGVSEIIRHYDDKSFKDWKKVAVRISAYSTEGKTSVTAHIKHGKFTVVVDMGYIYDQLASD